jgi:hypothetical protein
LERYKVKGISGADHGARWFREGAGEMQKIAGVSDSLLSWCCQRAAHMGTCLPRRRLARDVLTLALLSLLIGCQESDEQVLRREFGLTSQVKLLSIKSYPEKPGFFGREGLDITASFEFEPVEFEKYLKSIQKEGMWQPMPPDREFIVKLTGIRWHAKSVQKRAEITGNPAPPLGSERNPTEDQLYERWLKILPLEAKNGFYQCKTAGDNLLYSRKKAPCSEKSGDLNDFMFAVLDADRKVLRVKVRTMY